MKEETGKRIVVAALREKRSENTPSIQHEYTRKRMAAVAIGCQYPYHTTTENHMGILIVSYPTETGNPVSFLNVIADITRHTF